MTEKKCANCKYLMTVPNSPPGCRRFPPQVSYIIVPKLSQITQRVEPREESRSSFPSVSPEWSCGEYAPHLELTS